MFFIIFLQVLSLITLRKFYRELKNVEGPLVEQATVLSQDLKSYTVKLLQFRPMRETTP